VTLIDIVMLVVAVMGGAAALLLVTARNVFHAALYLVVALLSVAGTFLLIGAEFLAWAQVLVYVGAVVVLILFGLMLTRAPIGPSETTETGPLLPLLVSGGLFAFLVSMIVGAFGDTTLPLTHTTTRALGDVLYLAWAFPFMVIGFFLTVALIGAIVIARREEGEGPEPPDQPERPERLVPAPTDASVEPGEHWTEAGAEAGAEPRTGEVVG
jgi:NADH:ubiquinone oxidoreductase subunit 6 (subunit J)